MILPERMLGETGTPSDSQGVLEGSARRTGLLLVMAGFALGGFVLSALLVHMLPVLGALGLGASAALVGMLFGPAQVLSRVGNMVFGGGLEPVRLVLLSASLIPISLFVLLLGGTSLPSALVFALIFGLGSGLVSIVRGTVPLVLFGPKGYGERLGQITAVRLVVTSLAPFAVALAIERFGVKPTLIVLLGLGVAGVLAFVWVGSLASRTRRK